MIACFFVLNIDCTVQEETELCASIPTVQPNHSAHYTFPYMNSKFPEMYDASSIPRMHLKPLIGSPDEQQWSSGIDLSQEQDRVISVASGLDLKLHVEKVAMLTHVVVETVSKAEISAKEIRSRIKGGEKTVVVSVDRAAAVSSQGEQAVLAGGGSGDGVSFKSAPERLPSLQSLPTHHHSQKAPTEGSLRISLGVFLRHFCFVMLDESSSEDSVGEVLRVSVDNSYITYYPVILNRQPSPLTENLKKHCLGLCVGDLQIDNQCFEKGQFDFPVMLVRQDKRTETCPTDIDEDFFSLTVIEKHAFLRRCSLIHAQLVQLRSPFSKGLVNDSLDVAMQPLCIYIDDSFVYRILKETEALLPVKLSVDRHQPVRISELPSSIFAASLCGADPAVFRHLSIQPIRLLLSVHASLKVFIASDQTPLTFGKFERAHVFTTAHQLSKTLVMHYVSGAIFRAGQ